MFDIFKKLDEDQNNGKLNSEEPYEKVEEKVTVSFGLKSFCLIGSANMAVKKPAKKATSCGIISSNIFHPIFPTLSSPFIGREHRSKVTTSSVSQIPCGWILFSEISVRPPEKRIDP